MKAKGTTVLTAIAALLSIEELPVQRGYAFVIPRTRKVAPVSVQRMVGATTAAPLSTSIEKLSPEAQELETILEDNMISKKRRKILVAQTAPSVRISFPELYGEYPGSFDTGVLVASLKELGFDVVLDTNTAADLTICEEGTELLHRVLTREKLSEGDVHVGEAAEPLPLFTSCCPGWMNMVEKTAPELIPYISTCKSPHMMYGAVVKRNSESLFGCSPDELYMCSVMPCVKKRGESDHAVFSKEGIRDVDNVITTKDLGVLLGRHGIDPRELEPMPFDSPFQNEKGKSEEEIPSGLGTGAGQLFGATGGVMEASVRSVYELITGAKLPCLELTEVRGFEGLKETTVPLYNEETGRGIDIELRVAVINGLGQAKKLIQQMKDGEVKYDFVEVMACPGGCIGGGGQPKLDKETLEKRMATLYDLDKSLPIRRSHDNPTVKKLYDTVLGKEYGSAEAKDVLHVKQVYGGTDEVADDEKKKEGA